ncbi:MAG: pilus assembly protein [Schwartzia sp.]|nr:pilus assembly protein [Schwartzia sp. (in: firmicutes)]
MRKQNGQAVVEFALVLPFFLMLCFGIMFAGLLFSDYLTLSNLARESARSASIQGKDYYKDIREAGQKQTLLTRLYSLKDITIEDGENSSVKVTLNVVRNSFPGAGLVEYLLPEDYSIVYSMYKEYQEQPSP